MVIIAYIPKKVVFGLANFPRLGVVLFSCGLVQHAKRARGADEMHGKSDQVTGGEKSIEECQKTQLSIKSRSHTVAAHLTS